MGEPSSCKQTSKHPGIKLCWGFRGHGPHVSKALGEHEIGLGFRGLGFRVTVQKLAKHGTLPEHCGLTVSVQGLVDLSVYTSSGRNS